MNIEFNQLTSEKTRSLIGLIEKHFPLSEERLRLGLALMKLHSELLHIEMHLIIGMEVSIASVIVEDRYREVTNTTQKLKHVAEVVTKYSADLIGHIHAENARNPTTTEKEFLINNFVSKSGKICRNITLDRSEMKDQERVSMIELLAYFNLLEVGLYKEIVRVRLTELGEEALGGRSWRLLRAIKKLFSSAYSKLIVFISGLISGLIASQMESYILPFMKRLVSMVYS